MKAYYVDGTEPKKKCTNHYATEETVNGEDHETIDDDETATPSATRGTATATPSASNSPKPTSTPAHQPVAPTQQPSATQPPHQPATAPPVQPQQPSAPDNNVIESD